MYLLIYMCVCVFVSSLVNVFLLYHLKFFLCLRFSAYKFGLPHFKNYKVKLQTGTRTHNALLVVIWEGKRWAQVTVTLMHYGSS